MVAAIEEAYTKQANKTLGDVEREIKSLENLQGTRLAFALFNLAHTRQTIFDQRTHRKLDVMIPRFPWVHLAATYLPKDNDALRDEIEQYWTQSMEQIEPLRGGPAAFNDLLRELMLTIVSTQWVDYLDRDRKPARRHRLASVGATRSARGIQAPRVRDV